MSVRNSNGNKIAIWEDRLTASQIEQQYPGITKVMLWRWARDGLIPAIQLPSKRWLFLRSDVEALLTPIQPGSVPADQPKIF